MKELQRLQQQMLNSPRIYCFASPETYYVKGYVLCGEKEWCRSRFSNATLQRSEFGTPNFFGDTASHSRPFQEPRCGGARRANPFRVENARVSPRPSVLILKSNDAWPTP